MFELRCKTCNKLIGETSVEGDATHECGECYEERMLEENLRAGFNFTARELSAAKIKAVAEKVADSDPQVFIEKGFDGEIGTIVKNHPKVMALRDEIERIGLEQAAERERTHEKAPDGTYKFI